MATDHDFKIKNGARISGERLILGSEALSQNADYVGMKTHGMTGASDYMIISAAGSGDNNTYISAKSGASVYIRGGGNTSGHQLQVSSTGATFSGDVVVSGNFTVNGTTTTLNTATLQVEDKNIVLNYGTGNTVSTANGSGITIQDAMAENHDATILWDTSNDRFNFSDPVNVGIVGPNSAPSADSLTLSGYGILGNRSASVYITNSNSNGTVQIGVGGAHNVSPKLTVSSSTATFTVPVTTTAAVVTDTSSTGRGIYRNNAGYDLRVGGGTNSNNGAYISISGETRGGSNSAYNGRIEYYSGGTGFANQAAILGDHVWYAKHAGGSANLMMLDSATGDLNLKLGDFEINGTTVIDSSRNLENIARIRTNDGSPSAPAYSFSNDTNTGMYRNSDDILGFTAGGARRGYFASSGIHSDANVYTGSSSAFRNYGGVWRATTGLTGNGFSFANSVDGTAMTLSSTGVANFAGNLTAPNLIASTATYSPIVYGGSSSLQLKSNTGEMFAQFTNDGAAALYFNNVSKLATQSYGANLSGVLLANDGSASAPAFSFSNDSDTGMYRHTTNSLGFSAAGGAGMVLNASGLTITNHVAINNYTMSADVALGVRGHGTGDSKYIFSAQDSGGSTKFYIRDDGVVAVSGNQYLYAASSGTSFYSQGHAVFRGNVSNDSGDLTLADHVDITSSGTLKIAGTQVISSGRALTNITSINTTGAITAGGKLTLSGAEDEILTLNSTDNNGVYMSFERENDRHGYVGFGGSNDLFSIVNEESGGSVIIASGNVTALTLDGTNQDATFAGTVRGTGFKINGTTVIDSGRNLLSIGSISASSLTTSGDITVNGNDISMAASNARVKYRVWSNDTYGIGMHNTVTYGGINNNYAMTFQMNNDVNRGFLWFDSDDTLAQGAMALTTDGRLTVAGATRIGFGKNDTTAPATYNLNVNQTFAVTSSVGNPVTIGADGTYGTSGTGRYVTLGFGGTTNGSNRIFAHNTGEDHIYLAAATGRGIVMRTNGAGSNSFHFTSAGNFQIGATTVISSGRGLENVTLQGGIAGARFVTNNWIYDDDNDGRFYFGLNGPTYYKSTSGHRFRANGDVTRLTIDNAGRVNLYSGGDTNAPGGAALAVAGTSVLTTGRVLQNVSVDTTTSIAPAIRGTVAGVDNTGYVHAFKVDGGNLSSQIRFTVGGTVGSVVFSNDVSVVCNHYRDILIESTSGFYTILTVKVVSNGNEDFSVFFKSNSANTATVNIVVFPLNDEVVTITTTDPSYSGRTLEHTCDYGKKFSATNNATPDQFDITTDGDIDANKYQISGTTVIGSDRTVRVANGSVSTPTITFNTDTNTGLYRYGTDQLGFTTAGAYRGMFDNSGNFIVGGTSNVPGAGNAATGVSLYNDGRIFAAKDGNTVMSLNRNSSNGVIAEFRYAGNTIGNIGVEGSDSLYIQSDGTGGGGLRFHNSGRISPVRNGALINNTIDLGASTQQFANLYLGTGLYMGGTQIVNSSRNLVNIGTITATAANSSLKGPVYIGEQNTSGEGGEITLNGSNGNTSHTLDTLNGYFRVFDSSGTLLSGNSGYGLNVVNGYRVDGIQVINGSRVLQNVTASGDIITSVTTTDDASWHDVVIYSSSGLRRDTSVEVHGSGYLRASYLNMSHSAGNRTGDNVFFSSNDDYIRKNTASGFRTSLDVYSKAESDALFTDTGDIDLGAGSVLTRSNHHTGHMEGSYNNISANPAKSNPIYTIGSGYNPTDAALSNMYGIGFAKKGNATYLGDFRQSGWGMYVASDGDARVFLNAQTGVVASTAGYDVGATNVIDSSRNLVNIGSITAAGNMSITGELKSTNAGTNAIKTRFISGAASASTSDGNLYVQHAKTNNILCFNGTSGNPQFLVYGNDSGTQRSGTLQIGTDGSFNITASDTYLILNAGSYIQSNDSHNFIGNIMIQGTAIVTSARKLQNVEVTSAEAEYGQSLNGNFGQWQSHSAYNSGFNTNVQYWGWNYINSNTNAPHTASSQWYRNRVSLGNAYGHGSSAGDYWLEMAYPRYGSGSTPGHMYIRTCENGTIGSWYEVGAHLRGNLNVGTNTSADINLGSDTTNARLIIKKDDNNVPDHIKIFCDGTQTGEIGSQDTTWLRINQSIVKNIYTPRYIRADSGFFVDNTATGLDGSGRLRAFAGSTSSVGIGFANDIDTGFYHSAANNIGFVTAGAIRANLSSTKLLLKAGLGLDLETSSGNVRGLIGAFETGPHLRISTSNNESIGFYDGGTSGTQNVDISGSGALTVRDNVTAYGSFSDIRLKENIEAIPNAIQKVQKLEGVTFNYKKDGSRSTGLIAQQLQEVLPEVVYETKDLDTQETHYAVRYGNVVGLLVEAIKEQQTQLTAQQEQINQLTNLVNTLMEK